MRLLKLLIAIFVFAGSPAVAKDVISAWTVAQKSGDVRVLRGGVHQASVQVRSALAAGDVVATGTNGRAMLTNGDDYVVVAPGSRLVLPATQKSGFTSLMQQLGTMLYKVKKTGKPHFAVETPVLAAVVKGTTFTVVVDDNRAAVQVTEGLVEVSSLSGDAKRLVEGGLTVYIDRERPNEIFELKSGATVIQPIGGNDETAVKIEGSGEVALESVTQLTDGLVRVAPTAPAPTLANVNVIGGIVVTPAASTPTTSLAPVTGLVTSLLTDPAAPAADSVVPGVTETVIGSVEAALPALADPVLQIVDATAPAITAPIIGIVETTVPVVTGPIIDIVEATVPIVTAPVVEIVTTAPVVVAPIVEIVDAVAPIVTAPIVEIVTTVPVVTAPIVEIVEATVPIVPIVTAPIVEIPVIPVITCTLFCPQ